MEKKDSPVEIKLEEEDVEIPLPDESISYPPAIQFLQRAGLPPKYVNLVNENRKQVYIALGIIAVLIIIAIIGIIVFLLYSNGFFNSDSESFEYGTSSIYGQTVGPILIRAGQKWTGTFSSDDITRPSEDMLIHEVSFFVEDLFGNIVSLEQVFIEYICLSTIGGDTIAEVRQEGSSATALKLPLPYVISLDSTEQLQLYAELVNMWGLASNADVSVNIVFNITYHSNANFTDELLYSVYSHSLGDSKSDWFHNINNTGTNNVLEYETNWNFKSGLLVASVGYLTPGGLNISVYEVKENELIYITSSTPTYNLDGYITSQEMSYPTNYTLLEGSLLKVISYYNATTLNNALSYFNFYGTFDGSDGTSPPPSVDSPSISPSPSKIKKSSSPSPSPASDVSSVSVSVTVSASASPSPSTSPSRT